MITGFIIGFSTASVIISGVALWKLKPLFDVARQMDDMTGLVGAPEDMEEMEDMELFEDEQES